MLPFEYIGLEVHVVNLLEGEETIEGGPGEVLVVEVSHVLELVQESFDA